MGVVGTERAPVDSNQQLMQAVRRAYSAAADRPEDKHAFPVGRRFAESIGYPADVLDTLPRVSWEAFTGVSCVSIRAHVEPGCRVLDVGCGAGLDALIASRRAGPAGLVMGVDFSDRMLWRARRVVGLSGFGNLGFEQARAESLPFADATFDVAMVNGIFNLNPARSAVFGELARVIRPHGTVWAAELIAKKPAPRNMCLDASSWFA